MALRLLVHLVLLGLGLAVGWFVRAWVGALCGVVAAALLIQALDLWQSLRFLRWLRGDEERRERPALHGPWREAADRVQRMRRMHGEQLQVAEARLQGFLSAIQASPNGVVLLDARDQIEWINQTAAGHLAIDPVRDQAQAVGHLVREPIFRAYLAGATQPGGVVIPGPGSTATRPVRIAILLHAYGQGRRLMLTRDVTAIEQAEAMRRDFVANVSHEIRTPLTVLAGFIETLQDIEPGEAERRHFLDLMARQAERMQALVNDLLTLSRLEGSPPPPLDEWTSADELLQACEAESRNLSAIIAPGGQTLEFRSAPGLAFAGVGREILSALVNLANNAVRYTPAGGSVTVACELLSDGGAELVVSDTGPGIAAEHIPRLTERFYRIDRSRSRETGGTGLGLAIVKHVAQRHGGLLRIDSVPGRGSRFALRLPAARVRRPAVALSGPS